MTGWFIKLKRRIREWLGIRYTPMTTTQERITTFQEGCIYKYVGPKKRPNYFNSDGEMDFVLNGRLLVCTEAEIYARLGWHPATFDNIRPSTSMEQSTFYWLPEHFVKINKQTWKNKLL